MSLLKEKGLKYKKINLERIALKAATQTRTVAVDLVTDDQLGGKGIDSDGNSLGSYAPFTVASKRGQSGFAGITGHVTLFGEGDFHKSVFLNTTKFPLVFDATDSKKNKLLTEWGDVLGLTPTNKKVWTEDTSPIILEEFGKEVRAI